MHHFFSSGTEELLGIPPGGHSVPKVYRRVCIVGCFFYGVMFSIVLIGGRLTTDYFVTSILGASTGILFGSFISKSSIQRLSIRKSSTVWELYVLIIILLPAYFLVSIWFTSIGWLFFISMEFITMGLTGYVLYRRFERTTNLFVKGGTAVFVWMEWLIPLTQTQYTCTHCKASLEQKTEICPVCDQSQDIIIRETASLWNPIWQSTSLVFPTMKRRPKRHEGRLILTSTHLIFQHTDINNYTQDLSQTIPLSDILGIDTGKKQGWFSNNLELNIHLTNNEILNFEVYGNRTKLVSAIQKQLSQMR